MTTWRTARRMVIAVAALVAAGAVPARAQGTGTLAQAKTAYASADYEDALSILTLLRVNAPTNDVQEIAEYQVFCLMALGRTDEARRAIESLVHIDPLFHPSDTQVSPRVQSFFEDVRRPLLPEIVRAMYAKAKADYDKKDMSTAASEFDRVIAVVDDMASADDPSAADLKTLASGFRDLAKSAAAPPPPAPAPTPDPATTSPAAGTAQASATAEAPAVPAPTATKAATPNDPMHIYGSTDGDVKPPTAIAQNLPAWNPATAGEKRTRFTGVVEVIINEDGSVLSAMMRESVQPAYDALLLKAASAWKYKPATRNGSPVKYRLHLNVQLGR